MTDPRLLPVWQNRDTIIRALRENQVIVVESPTGSGKTTQIPLILNEEGYTRNGIIGITQPRRIATLSVCSYIKNQIKDKGSFCGYKMRFYDTTSSDTRIKILTDGMLLQELKSDPDLSAYSVIMVDEAHERSLNIDFILGLLKQICRRRPDLKVIISSATLNTKIFTKYFNAPVISIKARQYGVTVKYSPCEDINLNVCRIINVLLKRFQKSGYKDNEDTLVFLPGEFEIKTCMNSIYADCDYSRLQIYPLYGRLNKEEQELVFSPTEEGKIKIVLATNIAETSLTIDGIRVVIDSGLAKINKYNQFDFTSSLITSPISRASADQRAGRAGRTSDGFCYRLYSQEDYENRPRFTQEEILRTDLSEVVLRMIDLGIKDFESFPYVTKPDSKALVSGEKTLVLLGAIDKQRNLTSTGELMVRYPLLPRHSRCMVEAILRYPEMISNIAVCVSFLSCKTPFLLPAGEEDSARACHKRFASEFGDFIGYQILFRKYTALKNQREKEDFCNSNYLDFQSMEEIVHVSGQLCDITSEAGIPVIPYEGRFDEETAEKCLSCLCTGLIQYVCIRKKTNTYKTLTADEIYIHPGSAWFRNPPSFLLAGEIVLTSKLYARTVSPLQKRWIESVRPGLSDMLVRLAGRSAKEDKEEKHREGREKRKTVNIYGFTLPVIYEGGKKDRAVAVIDSDILFSLGKAYRKASRHPKSVSSAILFKGKYLCWGERLSENLGLAGRVKFDDAHYCENVPDKIFFTENIAELASYMNLIMMTAPLKKYKDRLGFIELVSSGTNMFFHVNRYFNEALSNSAYSLLSLMDSSEIKAFGDTYNRIVRLLD